MGGSAFPATHRRRDTTFEREQRDLDVGLHPPVRELRLTARVVLTGPDLRVQVTAERRAQPREGRRVELEVAVRRGGVELGRRTFPMTLALDGSRPLFAQEYWDDFLASLGLAPGTEPQTLDFEWRLRAADATEGAR